MGHLPQCPATGQSPSENYIFCHLWILQLSSLVTHQRLVVWQIGEKTYLTYLTYSVFDFFASEILKWPVFNVFGVFTYLTFFIQILKCLVFNVFGVFTYLRIFASKILKCPVFSVFGVFTYLRFLQKCLVTHILLVLCKWSLCLAIIWVKFRLGRLPPWTSVQCWRWI